MDTPEDCYLLRRMDRVPNARIEEWCEVKKGLGEWIDEGVFWWFGHVRGWRMIGLRLCRKLCY